MSVTLVQLPPMRRLVQVAPTSTSIPESVDGVRIIDMPDLGAVDDTSSIVGERAGSGRFAATALRDYVAASLSDGLSGTTVTVAHGGTGATSLTGFLVGNGTLPFTALATIPTTAISGLKTMAFQDANNVTITGGTINNVTIDGGSF